MFPTISHRGLTERCGSPENKSGRKPDASSTDLTFPKKSSKKNNKALKKNNRHNQYCKKCMYDLRPVEPEEDRVYLPSVSTGQMDLRSQLEKEDTFVKVIDSLAYANGVPTSAKCSWNSMSPASNGSSPRQLSAATRNNSAFYSEDSNYSDSLTDLHNTEHDSHTTTIISQVPPARNVIYIPLDRLLDHGDNVRKVTIRCSKYHEIGNPQARKKKMSKASANKKWQRTISYANTDSIKGPNKVEKLNFMDKQINSIYNSYEKAKIDKQLSTFPKRKVPSKGFLPHLEHNPHRGMPTDSFRAFRTLPNKSVERFVLNSMLRAKKAARYECKIPTIPLSLIPNPRQPKIR